MVAAPGSPTRYLPAVAAALVAAAIWGGWFAVSRHAVREVLTPGDLALLRYVFAGTVLLPVLLRHGCKAGRTGWWGSIGLFLTVGAPYPYLLALGLEFAPAAHVAVFVPGVFPVLTMVAGAVLFGDRVAGRQWLGLVLAVLAVLLVAASVFASVGAGQLTGYLLFLLCACMWTAYTLIVRAARISALHATAIIGVLSLLLYGPFHLLAGTSKLARLDAVELLLQVGYHGFLGGLVSMVLYSYAVNHLGSGRAAIFGALVPCFAAVLSEPVAGDTVHLSDILAILLAAAGIALVTARIASPASAPSFSKQ